MLYFTWINDLSYEKNILLFNLAFNKVICLIVKKNTINKNKNYTFIKKNIICFENTFIFEGFLL